MPWSTPGTVEAGQVYTAARYNTDTVANLEYLKTETDKNTATIKRLAYIERTSNYTISATTVATAADLFSSDISFTANGTSSYLVEYYASEVFSGTGNQDYCLGSLTDGGNNGIAQMATVALGDGTRAAYGSIFARFWYTPTAGTKTLNFRWIKSGQNGGVTAGNGTSNALAPTYLAVYGPPLT